MFIVDRMMIILSEIVYDSTRIQSSWLLCFLQPTTISRKQTVTQASV